ncbi:MAG: cadherin-like domain-containing protein [Bacteroidota bacterium]
MNHTRYILAWLWLVVHAAFTFANNPDNSPAPSEVPTNNLICTTLGSSGSTPIGGFFQDTVAVSATTNDNFELAALSLSLTITHGHVGDLDATLISPNGERFRLFDRPGFPAEPFGCGQQNLQVTFTTEAVATAEALENSCISSSDVIIQGSFQPLDDWTSLLGGNSVGTWRIEFNDNYEVDGGRIESWQLDLCYAIEGQPLTIVNNNVLSVPRGAQRPISAALLSATDEASSAQQIIYQLNSLPTQGNLRRNGQNLGVGDTFTQADLNEGNVFYSHGGGITLEDSFGFTIQNNGGESITGNVFQVEITVGQMNVTLAQTGTISCPGEGTAGLSVTVSGGLPPYTYRLNDSDPTQSSNQFTDLGAGTYTVTVTDQFGDVAASSSLTINQPPALVISNNVLVNDVIVTAAGGTAPYSYSIDGGQTQQSSPIFPNLANDDYAITVTDGQGCTATTTFTVFANTLQVGVILTQAVSCHNATNGIITASVNGGTPPFTYTLGETTQNSPTFDALGPGSYFITIVDSEGFFRNSNIITLTNPTAITGDASTDGLQITVNASGGTPPLRYDLVGDQNGPQSSNVFPVTSGGDYTISVIDANDCTFPVTATVVVNTLAVSAELTERISCNGANDGQITASVSGGTPPFSYTLNTGLTQVEDPTFTGLGQDTYNVEVTDANGFTALTNNVTLINPVALTGEVTVTDFEIAVSASGGTPPWQYQLNNGSPQTGNVFNVSTNGTNTVTVIDANGCTLALTATVSVNNLLATAAVTDSVSCQGAMDAQITAQVTSGTPPYQYQLNEGAFGDVPVFDGLGAGNYELRVRDAAGFEFVITNLVVAAAPALDLSTEVLGNQLTANGSGGTGTLTYTLDGENYGGNTIFTDLPNATYTVCVRDQNDCETCTEATVNFQAISGNSQVVENVSCYALEDGSIIATIDGGVIPYSFSLDGVNYQASNLFEGLPADSYTIFVNDAVGNVFTTAPVTVSEPTPLLLNGIIENTTIIAEPSGGTPPYQYLLYEGEIQLDSIFTEVPAGMYNLVVMDANNCEASTLIDLMVATQAPLFGEEQALVYPNPGGGPFTLRLPYALSRTAQLSVYNKLGQRQWQRTLSPGTTSYRFARERLAAGVYQLVLTDGERWQTIRLVML